MSLVDRDQQIATLLRTMDEDDKRLILIAACIYTSSCTWLASEIRSLAGFTHADDSVADPQRIFEIVPWLLDISASSLDTILKRIVANGADKVIIEKLLHVTRHSTSSIAIILEDRMRKLDIMISQSLTRYKRQPYHIQPVPRASLLQLPLELFTMVIHSENLAFSDLRSLRQTCTELVHKCRDAFYNKIDSCTVSLLLDAEFPARAASLAKFEQWSYNITTLRLMVPRTAFFYKSQQGDPTAKSGNTFSAMAATAEFKSALGLLTTLPRCNTILLQHETLSSWRLCAFECNRRIVRDRTIAVLDVVMRENLEYSLIGILYSTQHCDKYCLYYFEQREEPESIQEESESEQEEQESGQEEQESGQEEQEGEQDAVQDAIQDAEKGTEEDSEEDAAA